MPALAGPHRVVVIDAPTVDPKTGRILAEDGYDEKTGLYLQLPPHVDPITAPVVARPGMRVVLRHGVRIVSEHRAQETAVAMRDEG